MNVGLALFSAQKRGRAVRNARFEAIAMAALDLAMDWEGATELAAKVGEPYRPLAFALRRLVERGLVEERIRYFRTRWKGKERQREYRKVEEVFNPFIPRVVPTPPICSPGIRRIVRQD